MQWGGNQLANFLTTTLLASSIMHVAFSHGAGAKRLRQTTMRLGLNLQVTHAFGLWVAGRAGQLETAWRLR